MSITVPVQNLWRLGIGVIFIRLGAIVGKQGRAEHIMIYCRRNMPLDRYGI